MVAADITAADVSVLGSGQGKLTASERVDIRSDGSLIEEVLAARISIEDGAIFKGRINVGKSASAVGDAAGEPVAPAETA
jgi:cytoskeletal protein CcmA (bactofilin family)